MNNDEEVVIDDEDVAEVAALPQPEEGKTIDWEAEAKRFQGMATRRGTKLAKVKSASKPAEPAKPVEPQAPKTAVIGYAEKAYLASSHDVKHADDIALVEQAMKDTGKTLDDVLGSKNFQALLKDQQEERATKEATPSRDGRTQAAPRDGVEYWVAKGELPPNTPENQELRRKVVNAKISKSKGGTNFSDHSVVNG